MLVLTRKLQQQIYVGDNITITILQVKGQSVRIGIEAPRSVNIRRAELDPEQPSCEELAPAADNLRGGRDRTKADQASRRRERSNDCPSGAASPLKDRVLARRTVNLGGVQARAERIAAGAYRLVAVANPVLGA